jgi:acyl-CoA thioester hydrolase
MSPTSRQNRNPNNPFTFPIRVYYEDTDAQGIVYHANYLKFAERGRTEFLRSLGYDHGQVLEKDGVILVVRHIAIDYHAAARLDDMLDVRTTVAPGGNTSLNMRQDIYRGERALAELKVVIVAITPAGKPVRMPPHLRQIFGG